MILVAIHHSGGGISNFSLLLLRENAGHLVVIKYCLIVVALNHGGMRDVHCLNQLVGSAVQLGDFLAALLVLVVVQHL